MLDAKQSIRHIGWKPCTNCKIPQVCSADKDESAYYVRSGITEPTEVGHFMSECKTCMRIRSSEKTDLRLTSEESRVLTENLAIKRLKQEGIWAQTGKASEAPDVDVNAWGCVWIEVKHSRLLIRRGKKEFMFVMTPKQMKRGFLADIILLICEWQPDEYTYHLLRSDDPVFYIDGRVKSGLTYRPGRVKALKHGNNRVVMTSGMMDEAQDYWGLVEEIRRDMSRRLSESPFPHRRRRPEEQD